MPHLYIPLKHYCTSSKAAVSLQDCWTCRLPSGFTPAFNGDGNRNPPVDVAKTHIYVGRTSKNMVFLVRKMVLVD
jgi:hypothetical protein